MRRASAIAFGAAAIVLVAAAGLYTWWWHRLAAGLTEGLPAWAAAREAEGLQLGWRAVSVDGFPFSMRIVVDGPTARRLIPPGAMWQGERLTLSARPWAPRDWQLAAPAPSRISLFVGPMPWSGRIAALDGSVRVAEGGTAEIVAREVVGEDRDPVRIATVTLTLGGTPKRDDAVAAATIAASRIALPESVRAPLGRDIESLTLRASLVGTVPPAPPAAALEMWRAAGGIVELKRVAVKWADLAVEGNGTLALDRALQPQLAGTATVSGHMETIDALSANGMMRLGEAIGAKLVLGALARPAEDGRPTLRLHVTVQDGQLLVGPEGGRSFRLLRIPPIRWPER